VYGRIARLGGEVKFDAIDLRNCLCRTVDGVSAILGEDADPSSRNPDMFAGFEDPVQTS
jgi:hypothetical protein